MGKKEQVPALAIFVQGSLWVYVVGDAQRSDASLRCCLFSVVLGEGGSFPDTASVNLIFSLLYRVRCET